MKPFHTEALFEFANDLLLNHLSKICQGFVIENDREELNILREKSKVVRASFIGLIKTGKSTLLNATIGENLLTTGSYNCTATTCFIQHNESYKIPIMEEAQSAKNYMNFSEYLALRPEREKIAEGVENVAKKLKEIQEESRDRAEKNRPYDFIKYSMQCFRGVKFQPETFIEFVDIPGVNEGTDMGESVLTQYNDALKFSDIFIYIMSALTPRSKEDNENIMNLIIGFASKGDAQISFEKLIFVVTHWDEIEESDKVMTKPLIEKWINGIVNKAYNIRICQINCGKFCTGKCKSLIEKEPPLKKPRIFFLSAKAKFITIEIEGVLKRGCILSGDFKNKTIKKFAKKNSIVENKKLNDTQISKLKAKLDKITRLNVGEFENYINMLEESVLACQKQKERQVIESLLAWFRQKNAVVASNQKILNVARAGGNLSGMLKLITIVKGEAIKVYDNTLKPAVDEINEQTRQLVDTLRSLRKIIKADPSMDGRPIWEKTCAYLEKYKEMTDKVSKTIKKVQESYEMLIEELEQASINCTDIKVLIERQIKEIAFIFDQSISSTLRAGLGYFIAAIVASGFLAAGGAVGTVFGLATFGLGFLFAGIFIAQTAYKYSHRYDEANKKYMDNCKTIIRTLVTIDIPLFKKERLEETFSYRIQDIQNLLKGGDFINAVTIDASVIERLNSISQGNLPIKS